MFWKNLLTNRIIWIWELAFHILLYTHGVTYDPYFDPHTDLRLLLLDNKIESENEY